MRWWVEVVRRGFRRYSTYRGAAAAGIVTQVVFGLVKAFTLLAVYRERDVIAGWQVADALTWVFLTQALIAPVDIFFRGPEIGERIRDGSLAYDLHRPVDFQAYWLAMDLGRAGFQALARGVPIVVLGALVFDLHGPASAAHSAAFVASVGLAVVVSFAIRFIIQLSALWLLDARGVQALVGFSAQFLSGLFVPVLFFPGWLEQLARWTPFPALMQVPIEVLVGTPRSGSLAGELVMQAAWGAGLLLVARVVLASGRRKVVIQGG